MKETFEQSRARIEAHVKAVVGAIVKPVVTEPVRKAPLHICVVFELSL